jgi:cytochrome c biogenesis protein CcdA
MSLLGALTPLGKVAHRQWIQSVLAYTAAGAVAASSVGILAGLLGHELNLSWAWWAVIPVALLLTARDWGLVCFPIPQRSRQTEKTWAHDFGWVMASGMWGVHIGLGFATYISYGGFWTLTLLACGSRKPGFAALLMLTYWIGRASPLWIVPIVCPNAETRDLVDAILAARPAFKLVESAAQLWSAMSAIILVVNLKHSQ